MFCCKRYYAFVHRIELACVYEGKRIDIFKIADKLIEPQELVFTPISSSSAAVMINQEMERVAQIAQDRLKRYKLSTWIERASKIVYI